MSTIGARLDLIEPGEVHISLPFSQAISQQHNYVHAGAITSIADSANGYAALTLTPPNSEVLTVEFKINLMASARSPHFVARGKVLRPGRRLFVCLAEVIGVEGTTHQAVAAMLSTIALKTSNQRGAGPA